MTNLTALSDPFASDYMVRRHRLRHWDSRRYGRLADFLFGTRLALSPAYRRLRAQAGTGPCRRVLVAGVVVPARAADLERMVAVLRRSRHEVCVELAPLGNRGKFDNINIALENVAVETFDWLIVVDDDMVVEEGFLDSFLFFAEAVGFAICQPAHRFHSYTSWQVTQRRWNSLAHATHFVECGPMTAFHRSIFSECLPFPASRWAWGLDVLWSEIARRKGVEIGIIDATPIEHLREVGSSYKRAEAVEEARELLQRFNVTRDVRELMVTERVIRDVRSAHGEPRKPKLFSHSR